MVSPERNYLLIELLQKETLAKGAAFIQSILFDQALHFKWGPMSVQTCFCASLLF